MGTVPVTPMSTRVVMWIVLMAMVPLPVGPLPALYASAAPVERTMPDANTLTYNVTVSADAGDAIHFRVKVPSSGDAIQLFFRQVGRSDGSKQAAMVSAYTVNGVPLPIEWSDTGYTVLSGGEPFFAEYSLQLQPTLLSPAGLVGDNPQSLRWDEYAYISSDVLLRVRGYDTDPVAVHLRLPDGWNIFASGVGAVDASGPIHFDRIDGVALLIGHQLIIHDIQSAVGKLTFVIAGALPWSVETLAGTLSALLEPLRSLDLVDSSAAYEFIIGRYPGALRYNPLITGHIVADRTLMHWVGLGTIDWWQKHTIRDFIALLTQQTLHLAPEASWFSTGLAEYVGLLLLFEAGRLETDELYQNLRNMYLTGARYSGPGWPSLAAASMMEPKTHGAGRVLQFRSPVVAFLLDTQLRSASSGAMSLLDWWASLAARQRLRPETVIYGADLLPEVQQFDRDAFAEEHILGTRVTAPDFDSAFNRWFATLRR